MIVALFLTASPAPRLYGVEVNRVLEPDGLRSALAVADVLITDTPFDTANLHIRRCVVLRTADSERFAQDNGFDCVGVAEIPNWFQANLGVDVSRRARTASATAPVAASKVIASQDAGQYKALYDGLVAELCKSPTYAGLGSNDGKTYDVLLQVMRGTLRKADNLTQDMQTVSVRLATAEADVKRFAAEREVLDEDISVILAGLAGAVSECSSVLNQIAGLSSDPELVEYSGAAVKARAAIGLSQKFASVVGSKELRAIGSVAREFMSCMSTVTSDLVALGTGSVKATAASKTQAHSASMAKANAERASSQAAVLLEQEGRNSANLAQQLTASQEKLNRQIQLTAEAENKLLLSGGHDVPALQEQIRRLRGEVQLKNEQLQRMEDIASGSGIDSNAGDLSPEVATGIIRQLRTQVASLKLERDRATAELMKAKHAAVRESERAETLSNNARSLSQVALRGSQVSALPLFNYAAKALIIPVFGNGSTGISSAAISLAKMLGVNSRTVILDLDLVATDLEGRFGDRINPLVKIEGVDQNSGKSTAMGLFIERGKDFFASHFSELVVRIDSNKAGVLDYLPGFYAKPDLFNLTQADYTTLLNYLGARYDYLVIDGGKLGCSEIGDQILRNLCLCAFRSLIVTDASAEKTRAMRLKLNDVFGGELRPVIERCVWLTNRAVTREDLTRFTAPSIGVTLPVLAEMVGEHQSFHITHGTQREFNKAVRALAGV